nr:unnamed protein product [Callosobruchus analis]
MVFSSSTRSHTESQGDYPCPSVFDGPGGVLAHATYPTGNTCVEIHVDRRESWDFSLNGSIPKIKLVYLW